MRAVLIAFLACAVISLTQAQEHSLMPMPAEVKLNNERFRLDSGFSIAIQGDQGNRLYGEATRFWQRLAERSGIFFKTWQVGPGQKSMDAPLQISFSKKEAVQLGMDESYALEVNEKKITLQAATDIGAIRGLETLFQLLATDAKGFFFRGASIKDKPRFAWRGLLISQPYHFMPMDVIKRTLDAMALVKMNVLHFYISDDQGYSIESKVYPKLHREASSGNYFTHEQIREIIAYADQRGIRVVPELDLPGHCTSILTAYPELAAIKRDYVLQDRWGVFDPVMDPTKEAVYSFLDTLLTEVASLFKDEYFHIGGDENTGKDWQKNDSIQRFMKQYGYNSTVALQNHFNRRVQKILARSGKKIIGWDEVLMKEISSEQARTYFNNSQYHELVLTEVPKDMVIQSWRGMEALISSAKNGYKSILSKGYYIDLMQSTAYHYLTDPIPYRNETIIPDSEANFDRFESEIINRIKKGEKILTPEEEGLIIGGEATMWTEHVTYETFDSRVWPRTAAIAERLWSAATVRDVEDMYRRLDQVSIQLEWVGSTHLKNADMMMRRLMGHDKIDPLKKLVGFLEPLKGYKRNDADNFTKYSPYTQLVDVAVADPKPLRQFNRLVDSVLLSKNQDHKRALKNELSGWKKNHLELKQTAKDNPLLTTAVVHSSHLFTLADQVIPLLEMVIKNQKLGKEKINAIEKLVKSASQPAGYCELMVVEGLQKLIRHYSK